MIERHNETVTDDDFVLMVGDLSAGLRGRQDHFKELLKLLNGKKILIRGNHDHQTDEFYLDSGFVDVVEYIDVDENFICHYPCYGSRWTSKQEKEFIKLIDKDRHKYIIHGHIHNKNPDEWEPDGLKRTNVSVDYKPNDYFPQEIKIPKLTNYLECNYK